MKHQSYGVIPLRRKEKDWEVLLIQHQAGHWAFPKGHPELNETPKEAAERELQEETGLTVVRYLFEEPLIESYYFTWNKQLVHKTVTYFIAEVKGHVRLQEAEVASSQWVPLSQATDLITFKEGQRICQQVCQLLA